MVAAWETIKGEILQALIYRDPQYTFCLRVQWGILHTPMYARHTINNFSPWKHLFLSIFKSRFPRKLYCYSDNVDFESMERKKHTWLHSVSSVLLPVIPGRKRTVGCSLDLILYQSRQIWPPSLIINFSLHGKMRIGENKISQWLDFSSSWCVWLSIG